MTTDANSGPGEGRRSGPDRAGSAPAGDRRGPVNGNAALARLLNATRPAGGTGPTVGTGPAFGARSATGTRTTVGTRPVTGVRPPVRTPPAQVPGAVQVAGATAIQRRPAPQQPERRFRMPGRYDPAPGERRLALVCGWAGALGLGGALVAVRLLINLFQADGGWYRPTVLLIGAVGVFATAGAFTSIHRPRLPWVMLGAGTAALVAAFIATAAA